MWRSIAGDVLVCLLTVGALRNENQNAMEDKKAAAGA
jgi:hypothetical protein